MFSQDVKRQVDAKTHPLKTDERHAHQIPHQTVRGPQCGSKPSKQAQPLFLKNTSRTQTHQHHQQTHSRHRTKPRTSPRVDRHMRACRCQVPHLLLCALTRCEYRILGATDFRPANVPCRYVLESYFEESEALRLRNQNSTLCGTETTCSKKAQDVTRDTGSIVRR